MRKSLQTIHFNLRDVAYLATPGVMVNDHSNGVRRFVTQSVEAAQGWTEDFHKNSRELRQRDPEGFEAWFSAYQEWRSGDLSKEIPHPEKYATK